MIEISQKFAPLISRYEKILRKEPEIILIDLKLETDDTKAKKFRKKFGVEFEEIKEKYAHLIVYSPWGQESVLIEMGVIISFIPKKFRGMKIIRRMLFLVLLQPYYRNLSGKSDLKIFYDSEIREFQKEFTSKFQGLLNENIINQYIAGVNTEELLQKIIPFLDFAASKSEVMENLYFVFKPESANKYQELSSLLEIDRFFTADVLSKANKFFQKKMYEYPLVIWNYSRLHLRLFRLIIIIKPEYANSRLYINLLTEKLRDVNFLLLITLNGNVLDLIGVIPENYHDWISQTSKYLEKMKNTWIISYALGFMEKIKTTVKKPVEINKEAYYMTRKNPKINVNKFDILLALAWREIFPSFAFIENSYRFFALFQKNLFSFFKKRQDLVKKNLPEWERITQKTFSQEKCKKSIFKLTENGILQPFTIQKIQHFNYQNKIMVSLVGKINDISNLGKYTFTYSYQVLNQLADFIIILTEENFLKLGPIICQIPSWTIDVSFNLFREEHPLHLLPFFDESEQEWQHEPFNPNLLQDALDLPIKSNPFNELKNPPSIPPKPFSPSSQKIGRELNYFNKVVKAFDFKKMDHDLIEQFLEQRFKNPATFDFNKQVKLRKTKFYFDNYENLADHSFPPPINSAFARIHVIIRSITRSVHPEALLQDQELRGIFAIGMVQCWYWGGTLDGVLLLEYYIPSITLSEKNNEFYRLLNRLKQHRYDIDITVLQVEHCQTFYNSYYLTAEDWKVGEFLRLKIPGGKPLNNGFTSVKYHQYIPLSSEPQADLVQTWYDDSYLPYNPVFGDWFHWLYLEHSITQFIYLKNIPKPQMESIYSFFRQAPIGEIYTCRNQKTQKHDLYIILRYRKQLFWMQLKIKEFLQSFQLDGFHSLVFPWTRYVHSPVSEIIRESRKNPWYSRQICYGMQFPIFHHHQWSICYGPEEQLEMYHLIPLLKGPQGGIPTTKKVKVEYELRRGNDITKKKKKSSLSEKLDYSKANSGAVSR